MKRPEEILQRQVVSYLTATKPDCLWFATSNQRGTRSRAEMGVLKAMGVRPGVADLVFVLPGQRAAFIELKSAKGVANDNQTTFRGLCEAQGIPYAICRTLDEVIDTLWGWGCEVRGRVSA